jgi:hypothetical protein
MAGTGCSELVAPSRWLQWRLKHFVREPVRMHIGALSPIHRQDGTITTCRPAETHGIARMPPLPHRSEQKTEPDPSHVASHSHPRRVPFLPASESPPPSNPPRNHPWSANHPTKKKRHGAKSKSGDMREIKCRLPDLNRALAGAATPVHHYHRHLWPTDLRLGRRPGNNHIWRAPFLVHMRVYTSLLCA